MSVILSKQLTYLLGERQKRFRPLQWRNFLPIKTGIPGWAESVEIIKVTPMGLAEPVPHQMGNQKAPTPSLDRSGGTLPMREFALAYQVFQAELERAQVTGVNVQSTAVLTNARIAEEYLDKIAAGVGGATFGLPGIASSADVPVLAIGGDWDLASDEQILLDVGNMIYAVRENTKQLHTANRVILPDTKYKVLTQRVVEGGRTLLQALTDAYPGVQILDWYKLRTAGAGLATRAIALDASEDVASMLMSFELRDGEPLKIHGGFEVLQTMRTGGVLIETPLAIVYADGV